MLLPVRVRVRQNAKALQSVGQKVGKLEVLEESENAVDNGCMCGPVACFVLRVVGTHQYLSLFLGGRGLVFACVCTPVGGRRLSGLRCVGSFFACLWGEKKGVAVLSARGTTQIRGGVGRT